MMGKLQLTRRQVIVYFLCLVSTAAFYFLYYWTVVISPTLTLNLPEITSEQLPPSGFLVYSENCQIPDVDPVDSTVKEFVRYQTTLDCSKSHPLLTYTMGNQLFIDYEMLSRFPNVTLKNNVSCCYSNLSRDKDGETDNKVRVENKCKHFESGVTIQHEFIKVGCLYENQIFYVNFHSFIHDKPSVEERCNRMRHFAKNPDYYSVLIVGADSVSRLNMHRQFPKTLNFLKKQMNAIEMFGYNKVGDNTFPNLIPMLTGFHEDELLYVCRDSSKDIMDKCPLLWKEYQDAGYRTFYAEDTPHISSFNYIKPGFHKQPTDYYFRPFILGAEDTIGWDKRMNCHFCIGPVTETQAVLSWLESFATNFQKRAYFAFAWINSFTHDELNHGSYGDAYYADFFNRLHSAGYLENTIVIFMSDHGMRWGSIRKTYIGRLEERLPALLISFPPTFQQKYPNLVKTVQLNAHKLITPFDLYITLNSLINFDGKISNPDLSFVPREFMQNFTERGLSFFSDIPKNRSCEEAEIAEHWCTCQKSEEISVNDSEVIHTAEYLLEAINSMVKQNSKCAKLSRNKIMNARVRAPSKHLKAETHYDISDYTVVIRTVPGKAIFEGTVRFVPQQHKHSLLGSISRLNVYGNQSICVDDAILRKYCYCI